RRAAAGWGWWRAIIRFLSQEGPSVRVVRTLWRFVELFVVRLRGSVACGRSGGRSIWLHVRYHSLHLAARGHFPCVHFSVIFCLKWRAGKTKYFGRLPSGIARRGAWGKGSCWLISPEE